MTINQTIRALYTLARILNTIKAISRGRIAPRLFNIIMGRGIASKLWR